MQSLDTLKKCNLVIPKWREVMIGNKEVHCFESSSSEIRGKGVIGRGGTCLAVPSL
jgi:hypothetical protein